MRDMTWIYAAVVFLSSEARDVDTVVRHVAFRRGSEVNLTCSNKTWSDLMYVVWTMALQNKKPCKIALDRLGKSHDTCKDGKSLRNTSGALSYLHISKFSDADEGLYECESAYTGGNDHHAIHVAIIVAPSTSAWLEHKDNKMVAVCRAERGKPAAIISWSHTGNVSSGNVSSVETGSNGFVTVESRLELPEGTDTGNLSCVVRHHNWTETRSLALKHEQGHPPWLYVLVVGAEDVEEVEPYASYVQRVNSIYNSSADLFT
ncbi:Cell surface glycoprotein CD200 receptor 1-B [Liparis tanakae]|uniref:Cell surface glycoprotein CD200 receptor 1-B n=1 Tax=Liparis tanakae TaxID=230148 RepID=A0A4Z2H1G7_9TELE|nr:Cell surface glycoprotein CD200 receptor 1-B [Liparis tanakae]